MAPLFEPSPQHGRIWNYEVLRLTCSWQTPGVGTLLRDLTSWFPASPCRRRDVFTSAPLEKSITVVGPLSIRLFAKSSAKDTDWFVTLTDVYADGRSIRVQEGALRARYREGLDHEVLMEPGRPYLFEIDLQATAQEFGAGHRIRLTVTSSLFPPRERNMNTGGVNREETTGIVAHNSVLHDRDHPSNVVLPVMA